MRSYSQDLRWRVVAFVDAGHSRRAAAAHFDVSVSFVVKLMAAFRLTGSCAAKPEGGWRYTKLDPHREFLERRIAEQPDLSMMELSQEMAERGVKIDQASLSRWYRRNGYSFKKKAFSPANRTGRMWQRRATSGLQSASH